MPILAPIVESIKILDKFCRAEAQKALVQSLLTAYIETQNTEQALDAWRAAPLEDDNEDPYISKIAKYSSNPQYIKMGAGTLGFLAPGDKITPVNSTSPNSGFSPFVDAQLRMIGAAVGLPFEMVKQEFGTSFSASRAAMNMATANFKVQRDWMTYDFCQPIYEEFMVNIVAKGLIKAPDFFRNPMKRRAYCMAKWSGPGEMYLDLQKEMRGYSMALAVGAMTHGEIANKMGSDFRQNVAVLHEEQQLLDANPYDRHPLHVTSEGMNTVEPPEEDASDDE
jgi:capsid protein